MYNLLNHYKHSVGSNYKHVQLTTKYRYGIMEDERIKTYCGFAIKEACKKNHIELIVLNVQKDHAHMIVDCPRSLSDDQLIKKIKNCSSNLIFNTFPELRKIYTKGHLWNGGYFSCNIGIDYNIVYNYIMNQDEHHYMGESKDNFH